MLQPKYHKITLWDIAKNTQQTLTNSHTDVITSIAFNLDGSVLASASEDKSIRLWDVKGDKELINLTGHTSYVTEIAFNSEGTVLASSSADGTVRIWGLPLESS